MGVSQVHPFEPEPVHDRQPQRDRSLRQADLREGVHLRRYLKLRQRRQERHDQLTVLPGDQTSHLNP